MRDGGPPVPVVYTPPGRVEKLTAPLSIPSAAYTILDPNEIVGWRPLGPAEPAAVGDVIVGQVASVGEHTEAQNRNGRVHQLHPGRLGLFVFGNRYATDAYEALVPDTIPTEVAMVAKGGVVADVRSANSRLQTPTKITVLGRAVNWDHQPISTLDRPLVTPHQAPGDEPRSRLILVVGTSMNAGKSTTAVAITRALTAAGNVVKGSKITGTASLKEILHVNDAGAVAVNDFTYLGYPSTYMLPQAEILGIFHGLDRAIANRPDAYWVVEIADGIEQRETAMLLADPDLQRRVHRLVFCAREALSVKGGVATLNERYGLAPDLIGGLVGGAPLGRQEVKHGGIDTPTFNALDATEDPYLVEVLTGGHDNNTEGEPRGGDR